MFDMFAIADTYRIKKAICIIINNLHTHATMTKDDKKELGELLEEFKSSVDYWEKNTK